MEMAIVGGEAVQEATIIAVGTLEVAAAFADTLGVLDDRGEGDDTARVGGAAFLDLLLGFP